MHRFQASCIWPINLPVYNLKNQKNLIYCTLTLPILDCKMQSTLTISCACRPNMVEQLICRPNMVIFNLYQPTSTAGNDRLHQLTSRAQYRLRVDLADANGDKRFAEFDNFKVASEADKYRMTYSRYSTNNFAPSAL